MYMVRALLGIEHERAVDSYNSSPSTLLGLTSGGGYTESPKGRDNPCVDLRFYVS